MEAANLVDADGLAALRRACAALRGWQDRARREVLVVCHGDVHPRNVLMRGDEVVIIDWDAICLGPPAWDHAALMTWADRWGGAAETYPDFARGYGADLMIIGGASNPAYAAEARARMRYWRGEPAAPMWTPF